MYEAVIPIRLTLADPAIALGDAIDQVTDELAVIDEQTPELLDYAVSSDATNNTAVFEVTVDAADEIEALAGAVSWVLPRSTPRGVPRRDGAWAAWAVSASSRSPSPASTRV